MLLIVMCLIYQQQSAKTYAGEFRQENVQETESEQAEVGGEEEQEKDSEESSEEKPENSEKETENPDEETKEPEEPEEPEQPAEPEKAMIQYELQIPKVNGKNGFYTKKPEISICHVSETGVTKYYIKHGDKKTEEEILKDKDEKSVIDPSVFVEGKNILYVWMENEEGEKIENFETKQEILIDTKAPEIQMSVPRGFDAWYQNQVILNVKGEDAHSGVDKMTCKARGKTVGSVEKNQGEFVIETESVMQRGTEISIIAEDKAGNKSEKVKTVYIDKKSPAVSLNGAKNYMITAEPLMITGKVTEENGLQEFGMTVEWENIKGRKKKMNNITWLSEGEQQTGVYQLKKDGIYHIKIEGTDLAGHTALQEMQVVIDKSNPSIRYLDRLKNQYIKKFRWEYLPSQMIWDFTTYTYDLRLDGQLYRTGKTIETEGKHKLTVKAIDAAGNRSYAEAEFTIDHTKPDIYFKNVEEGKEYEEECKLEVGLTGEEDAIKQIQINGENQKINSGRKTYQYTLHECKDYEVIVRAIDRAGNEAEKKIYFKVVPKEVLVAKMVKPVKKFFTIERVEANGSERQKMNEFEESKGDKSSTSLKVFAVYSLLGIAVVSGAGYYWWKKQKDLHKREDAG